MVNTLKKFRKSEESPPCLKVTIEAFSILQANMNYRFCVDWILNQIFPPIPLDRLQKVKELSKLEGGGEKIL